MKSFNQSKLDAILSGSSLKLANDVREMIEARQILERSFQPYGSITDQDSYLAQSDSSAVQMAKQALNIERQRTESIRKILDPLESIRKSLIVDSSFKRMLQDPVKPKFINNELANGYDTALKISQENILASHAHAQQTILASSISITFSQVMKTYEEAQKHWIVPVELINSVGALKAMQDQIGRLTLPVMDWASAATLAIVLGPEGIEAQFAALGIGPDGTITDEALQEEAQGIGLSRKTLELMNLLGLILAILVPSCQEISSRELQKQTDKKFEALSLLVEKAFVQEAKSTEVRFVVLDRVVKVRDEPKHSSTVMSKLLPREMVKLIAEQGKWIQFEYYHWLRQEYQTGWAMKKYFKRVSAK